MEALHGLCFERYAFVRQRGVGGEEGEDQPRDTCEPLERINQWLPYGKLVDLAGRT